MIIGAGLSPLGNERLNSIFKVEKEVIEKREHTIIQNIYKYSRENPYEQALLFIGSGHRQPIQPHIEEFDKREEIK